MRIEPLNSLNEVAKWKLNWQDIPNQSGGCMGMCRVTDELKCQVYREKAKGSRKFEKVLEFPHLLGNQQEIVLPH